MDCNHVPVFLLVGLCFSVGTYGQTNTTMAPANATTLMTNITNPTSLPSNVTHPMNASNPTSMPSNVTHPMMNASNPTSMPSNVTHPMMNATNPTSMPSNVTNLMNATSPTSPTNVTQQTTSSVNATTAAAGGNTTVASGNTTIITTAAPATTTTQPASSTTTTTATSTTTTAATIQANLTVDVLATDISRTGCASNKICASEPSECNPNSEQCVFLSTQREAGNNFFFTLSANSTGFVSLTLTPPSGGEATTYICARNLTRVRMITAKILNGNLTRVTLPVNRVKGRINGTKIDCTFAATVPNATLRTTATTFAMSVDTGTYDSASDSLGTRVAQIRTSNIDLSNASQNVTNLVTTTTTTTATTTAATTTAATTTAAATVANTTVTNTTSAGVTPLEQSMSNGFLLIFGISSLFWL